MKRHPLHGDAARLLSVCLALTAELTQRKRRKHCAQSRGPDESPICLNSLGETDPPPVLGVSAGKTDYAVAPRAESDLGPGLKRPPGARAGAAGRRLAPALWHRGKKTCTAGDEPTLRVLRLWHAAEGCLRGCRDPMLFFAATCREFSSKG